MAVVAVLTPSSALEAGVRPGTRAYHRVVVALFAAGVATFALLYSTQALLPLLAARFGVSAGASAWSLSVTTLGLAGALLVVGPLSDRVGVRGSSTPPSRSPPSSAWRARWHPPGPR